MNNLPPGDYTDFNAIYLDDFNQCISIKDPNFTQSKKQMSIAKITALIGIIVTISLAIFTLPIYSLLAACLTFLSVQNSISNAKFLENRAQNNENYLNRFIITKASRALAGDTYDDTCLNELFKVKEPDPFGKTEFYNVNTQPNGLVEVKVVRQAKNIAAWIV